MENFIYSAIALNKLINLEYLDISANLIRDNDAEMLANLPKLKHLKIHLNQLSQMMCEKILDMKHLETIQVY